MGRAAKSGGLSCLPRSSSILIVTVMLFLPFLLDMNNTEQNGHTPLRSSPGTPARICTHCLWMLGSQSWAGVPRGFCPSSSDACNPPVTTFFPSVLHPFASDFLKRSSPLCQFARVYPGTVSLNQPLPRRPHFSPFSLSSLAWKRHRGTSIELLRQAGSALGCQ